MQIRGPHSQSVDQYVWCGPQEFTIFSDTIGVSHADNPESYLEAQGCTSSTSLSNFKPFSDFSRLLLHSCLKLSR